MTSGPIDTRLRECEEEKDAATSRAAEWLRAIPEPDPPSESARQRTLRVLRASTRNARGLHLSALQWAVLSVLLVSTAAASSKRMWFPTFFQRRAADVQTTVLVDPAAATEVNPKRRPAAIERPPSTSVAGSARARASSAKNFLEEPKPEPVRPRLLSDPQSDSIPRVLPKLVYDAELYSILLDVCVSAEGDVTKVSVVRGQESALDRDILEAVRRWKYSPGRADGQPVAMCFPLVYRIQVQRD